MASSNQPPSPLPSDYEEISDIEDLDLPIPEVIPPASKKKRTKKPVGEVTRRGSRERTTKVRDDSIHTTTDGQAKEKPKKKKAANRTDESDSDFAVGSDEASSEDDLAADESDDMEVTAGPSTAASSSAPKLAPIFLAQARKAPPPKRNADEAELDDAADKSTTAAKKPKKKKKKRSLLPQGEPASTSAPTTRATKGKEAETRAARQAERAAAAEQAAESDSDAEAAIAKGSSKRSVIKLFYTQTEKSKEGTKVQGQTYWKCVRCPGSNVGPFTVTSGTGNLATHVKKNHPAAASLLEKMLNIAKTRGYDEIPEDMRTAAGTKDADITRFLNSGGAAKSKPKIEPFSQKEFEDRLLAWLIVSDQPFMEVQSLEFRALLAYLKADLFIPKADAIREKVMQLGAGLDDDLREYLSELKGKIHLALDAWTSSNGYAFLAITGHYIKNDGQLEEMLLDFIELEGRHTGENIANLVFAMLQRLGIDKKAGCFTTDGASNNNTTMERLQALFTDWDNGPQADFEDNQRHIRCLAHIVHLAALELLYVLDIFKPGKKKQSAEEFEEEYRAELGMLRATDETLQAMASQEVDEDVDYATLGVHSAAVKKLRDFVKKIKDSPLKKQALNAQIAATPTPAGKQPLKVLALILDVKTRWSSTHRMLERAVPYRSAIDAICTLDKDLDKFKLSEEEWDSVTTVSGWLFWFRRALEQIEESKRPTLALTIPVFNGLQTRLEALKKELVKNPDHSPLLLMGLEHAHNKLAQYYMRTDCSFFYTWATFLDPRFKLAFFKSREEYKPYKVFIEACENELEVYFENNYHAVPPPESNVPPSPEKGGADDITEGFFVKAQAQSLLDQWRAYRDSPREDGKVDTLNYWQVKSGQWPELARFAQDVISIPATAVSVERIFSGGRDTLSLRRASMLPNTLSTLMRLKYWIRLIRKNTPVIL